MFERKKYKEFAKKQLQKRWGTPILMSLFVFLFSGLIDLRRFFQPEFIQNLMNNSISREDSLAYFISFKSSYQGPLFFLTDILSTVILGIISVACASVYLKMSRSPEKITFSSFLQGFNFWAKAALATLWNWLWTFLWGLLFIIPGIIKSIAYSQMYYLIVEYPNLSVTKAMKISMLITKDHKADLFVMYLSFIGWKLLVVITARLGMIFLAPYMDMTFVNAYHALLKEAVESGKLKPEDLTE